MEALRCSKISRLFHCVTAVDAFASRRPRLLDICRIELVTRLTPLTGKPALPRDFDWI